MYLQAHCAESRLSALGLCRSVEYPFVGKKGGYYEDGSLHLIDHSASWIRLKKSLEKYKIYLGVKDVKLVARHYKTRTAFMNLTSSPPTIHLRIPNQQ